MSSTELFRMPTSIFTLKMCSCQQKTYKLDIIIKKHTLLIFRSLASLAQMFIYLSFLQLKMDCGNRNVVVDFQSNNYTVLQGAERVSLSCIMLFMYFIRRWIMQKGMIRVILKNSRPQYWNASDAPATCTKKW